MEKKASVKKALFCTAPIVITVAIVAILPTYFSIFVAWTELGKYGALMAVIACLVGALGFFASYAGENKTKKSVIVGTVAAFLSTILTLTAVMFLVNNIIFNQTQNVRAAAIVYVFVFSIMAVCFVVFCIRNMKNAGKAPGVFAIAVLAFYVVSVGVHAYTTAAVEKEVIPAEIIRTEEDFNRDCILIGGYGMSSIPEGNVSVAEQVKRAVDAGIDFMVTGNKTKDFLDACDKYGLGVILAGTDLLPHAYGVVSEETYQKWMALTAEDFYNFELNGDKIYAHECIWGVDVCDEPSSLDFDYLADMTAHFKEVIPEKFAFVNLYPIHASTTQLREETTASLLSPVQFTVEDRMQPYVNHIIKYSEKMSADYISFDIYPISAEPKHSVNDFTKWLMNLDIVSKNCNLSDRDLWIYIQSCGEAEANSGFAVRRYASEEDIRLQSYVSLSFGADTIIHACYMGGWFDAYDHSINPDGDMTDTYTYVQNVDKELKAFSDVYAEYTSKGAFTLNIGQSTDLDDDYLTPVDEQYKPAVSSDNALLVGCFAADESDGKAYTFVNMYDTFENKTAELTVEFEDGKTVTIYRGGVQSVLAGTSLTLELNSGEGVFVTVE